MVIHSYQQCLKVTMLYILANNFFNSLASDCECLRGTSPMVLLLSNLSAEIGPPDGFNLGPDSTNSLGNV